MQPRFAKVSEIAERFRVSADAVYLWIKQGKIPSDCVVRIAGTVRVDEEQFERCLRSGALCQPRGRKRAGSGEPDSGDAHASTLANANLTNVAGGPARKEMRASKTGEAQTEQPFSPEMDAEK
jgi:hypothetical protein